MTMHYLHTMIRISSIDESLHFYCDILGLIEKSRYDSASGRFTNIFLYAQEDADSAQKQNAPLLELTYNWPTEDGATEAYTKGRNFGHLAFAVTNIYDTCTTLMKAGVTINRPPRDGHMAFIVSPDGISIELLQQGSTLTPQEPWLSMPNTGSW